MKPIELNILDETPALKILRLATSQFTVNGQNISKQDLMFLRAKIE